MHDCILSQKATGDTRFVFQEGLISKENGKAVCFLRVHEVENILKKMFITLCQGGVAHCFKLLHNVRYRTTSTPGGSLRN